MTPRIKTFLIHGSLFVITFVTTTLAGAEWTYGKSILSEHYTWSDFASGLPYAFCFLAILTCHEFGHYFTAIYYRIKTSLPYYIPIPSFIIPMSIGTLGALIRIRERILTNKQQFDVGIAGPLAGFVVALVFLIYGFVTLPPAEHIYQFHPKYKQYGLAYADHAYDPANMPPGSLDIVIGKNLLFSILEKIFADPARMPNPHEIIHYPFLFAGLLSLVFTCLNLLPIGQLDGGHVLYGLLGYRKHKIVATAIYVPLLFYCGLGFIDINWPLQSMVIFSAIYLSALYRVMMNFFENKRDRWMYALLIFATQYLLSWLYPAFHGYTTWLFFLLLVGAFAGVKHPPSPIEEPLNRTRKILGWLALLIFILCLTPDPIDIILPPTATP